VHRWRSPIRHSVAGRALEHVSLADIGETVEELDAMFEQWGREEAERGARLAREHGLDARPCPLESSGPPARAILEIGDAEDAAAIVTGRGGRGRVASALLGSVTSSIVHAAERPVLVV
jgi:nucleotide-binding universal stress UspA family protein